MYVSCGGQRAADPSAPPQVKNITAIQHVVFIFKENRTFDNYFGTFSGADGATTGITSTGKVVPLIPMPDRYQGNLCNSWSCAIEAMNGGKMDRFDLISGGGLDAYTQLAEPEIPNYWAYARQFVLADRYFTSVHGPTFPNHLYSVAAQSGGVIGNNNGENPGSGPGDCRGGTATVPVIDSSGKITDRTPCFDFPTLADRLDSGGLTWKYYSSDLGGVFNSIKHILESPHFNDHFAHDTQFAIDAQSAQLPAMSWVLPPTGATEHKPESVCQGENWTVSQLNAVMQGPDWDSTAVFLTYDDFGGLYDHAPPPQIDQFGFGPRVPLLIISPFAKAGYISHAISEHSSVLKFVETRYQLSPLTARDSMASALLDAFDFNQAPQPPLILQLRTCP